jgi:hypothetical protein
MLENGFSPTMPSDSVAFSPLYILMHICYPLIIPVLDD